MQNRVVVFTFSFLFFFLFFFLCGKIFFVPNAEFSGGVHIFCFKLEARCLFKFGSTIQHCQFKWKFSSQTNLIGKNIFRPIWTKRNRNCQFCTKTSWNMENSMVLFTFFMLDGKHPLLENSVKKMVPVSFTQTVVQRLFRICKIQQWCSLFQIQIKMPFLRKFGPKHQNCQFYLKFGTYTN